MDPSYNSNVPGPVSPTPQPTISSGGDIFLPPSQPTMTIKKSKKPLIITIIIIIILALAGVAIWLFMNNSPTPKKATDCEISAKFINNINNRKKISKEVITIYKDGGKDQASKYFSENFSYDGENTFLAAASQYQINYFSAILEEYDFYNRVGCMAGNDYSQECIIEDHPDQASEAKKISNKVSVAVSKMTDETLFKAMETQCITGDNDEK